MAVTEDVALDYASIISTILEAVLYGFSVFMFGTSMYFLLWDRTKANVKMLFLSIGLFVFSTMHMAIDSKRLADAFVYERQTPQTTILALADTHRWTLIFKHSILWCQTLLGDGIVIWRLYVVTKSYWLIGIPLVAYLGVWATGISLLWHFANNTPDKSNIFVDETVKWVTSFLSVTLAANVLATGLLAFRLWNIDRKVSGIRVTRSPIMPLVRAVADSGVLYSVVVFLVLVFFAVKSNIQYIFLDLITPTISIAFNLIILRMIYAKHDRSISSRSQAESGPGTNSVPLQVRFTSQTIAKNEDDETSSRQKSQWRSAV